MLLVWLFGLTAGLVNACVLSAGMPVVAQPLHVAHAHGGDSPAAEQANCQDFCAKSSQSVVSIWKSAFDGLDGVVALPAPSAPSLHERPALLPGLPSPSVPMRRHGPALTIALLRLAL